MLAAVIASLAWTTTVTTLFTAYLVFGLLTGRSSREPSRYSP